MENLYPLFERNRILKKEQLWSLRDYAFVHVQLEYQEYGQGVIQGCGIRTEGQELVIGSGIVKYGHFLCLLMEEQRVPFQAADQRQYLKLRVGMDSTSPDYISYQWEVFLDSEEKKAEDEFELCRFYLRKGARLRDQYEDFYDMETEYDTINLLHGDWAGLGGSSLAPAFTQRFAKELLAGGNSQPEDRAFAYFCLSQRGALPVKVLKDYVRRRCGMQGESEKSEMEAEEIYKCFGRILTDIKKGGKKEQPDRTQRRRILVD